MSTSATRTASPLATTFKRTTFDAIFFTYSLCAVIYFAYMLQTYTGPLWTSLAEVTQETLIKHMGGISLWVMLALILSAALSVILHRWHILTVGEILFAPAHKKQQYAEIPFFKSFWGLYLSFTLFVTLVISAHITNTSLTELFDEDGFAGAYRLYSGLVHANLDLLPTAIVEVIETIFIAFLATAISVPLAFLLAFVCAKNIMTHPFAFVIYMLLRTFLNIARSVEPLIWAVIFTVWVGVGPFAGMLALMIHSIVSLAKQYSEIVEDVSEGPIEGIKSTGANTIQVIWYAIVPQVVLPYIAFTIFRWDINVRMATVIGLVGGGGIGTLLIKYQGQAMWPEVGCIIVVIAAVVWLMDTASAYIREAIR